MAEANPNVIPAAPATQATAAPALTLTLEQIKGVVDSAVAAALKPIVDNQKVIADTLAADAAKAAKDPAAKTEPAKALTQEDVDKLVSAKLDAALKAQQATAQSTAARDAYITEKLKGVPKAYQSQLGTDPAKWPAEEQAIRDGLKADLAAMGATVKDVAGGNPGGATAATANVTEVAAKYKTAGLSDGEANFAAGIKLPG